LRHVRAVTQNARRFRGAWNRRDAEKRETFMDEKTWENVLNA
jgi:hypothetical protein